MPAELTVEQIENIIKKSVSDAQKEAGQADTISRKEVEDHIKTIMTEIKGGFEEAIKSLKLVGDNKSKSEEEQEKEFKKNKELKGVYSRFGEQLMDVVKVFKDNDGGAKDRLNAVQKAASGLSESVPSDGGFLVQTDFSSELIKRINETGMISSRCRRIPISANSNGMKINAINETSRATGSRMGGVQVYWLEEAGEKTASKPKFRQMSLQLNKLIGLCYATDELLQDAIALEAVIMQGFEEEFGFVVDDSIIRGTGAGQPLGILNSPALVTVSKETSQAATTIVAENVINMRARLWARSRSNSVWCINQDCEPQLQKMSLPVGTGGVPVFLPANGLAGNPYDLLFGRPVLPVEYCATMGTVGDMILADFNQYLLVDKGGIQSDRSIHVRFVYDETCFRFVMRLDGQPIWNSPLTPYKGTATLSPFVVLETRS